ncbi:MerR family transcriptional regulator [Fructilactobacillus fructivorans]|uniref:MerR family transcriptional regulator n=1 Tax=Fructilactobacillus fructivorans TaxID=1614 RepID=A0AAE6NZ61_9LACO|nr:MerR family transcriptional regulator [Fructilactobacillus fructivorans]QFX92154.1 MerR family transcriptional regulator [Fructilactobacillus fructivorans]RDV65202.1 MerR family transcriptional regulator [Fructilactobacillus fructivorans]
MLKISEMADLANTTRRTLIFYDQQDVFKPAHRTKAGYRYYDYQQLYDLLLILGLRKLDISLSEIKVIQRKSNQSSREQLFSAQTRIDAKINKLLQIQKVINQKIEQQTVTDPPVLYQPAIKRRVQTTFWCSKESATCTEEEVAQLFSEFYKQLNSLSVIDTGKSGFLTNLPVNNPNGYPNASFRVIKETVSHQQKLFIPMIKRDAGNYVCILVKNDLLGITRGLKILKSFCETNHLETQTYLWQINSDNNLIKTGASEYGWLEYALLNPQEGHHGD